MSEDNFGLFLHKKRIDAKLTQVQLADEICKTGMYISNIEKGKNLSPPKQADLDVLAEKLSLNPADKFLFFELAAADRKTLPARLIEYINQCTVLKKIIQVGVQEHLTNEDWTNILKQITGGNHNA